MAWDLYVKTGAVSLKKNRKHFSAAARADLGRLNNFITGLVGYMAGKTFTVAMIGFLLSKNPGWLYVPKLSRAMSSRSSQTPQLHFHAVQVGAGGQCRYSAGRC